MAGHDEITYKASLMFDPNKGFLELPVVQWALLSLICLCGFLVAIVISTEGLKFQFDAEGLSTFASLFRVPVGAFTLSLPVFALLAANHRSEQTKQQMALTRSQIERTDRQIQIASDQSKFSNYYKHLEEFIKYCDLHFKNKPFGVASPRKLHAAMYPAARQGDLNIDKKFLANLDNDISELYSLVSLLAAPEGRAPVIFRVNSYSEELLSRYFIQRIATSSGTQIEYNGKTAAVPGRFLSAYIIYQIQIIQTIDEALAFDAMYISSMPIRQILDFSRLLSQKGEISLSGSFDFDEIDKQVQVNL